jgi:hypothetical protein
LSLELIPVKTPDLTYGDIPLPFGEMHTENPPEYPSPENLSPYAAAKDPHGLRRDAKTNLFDRIYFHAADRITREAAHQTIIIGGLLNRGKQLTIGGKDYQQNPENKLTVVQRPPPRLCTSQWERFFSRRRNQAVPRVRFRLAGAS